MRLRNPGQMITEASCRSLVRTPLALGSLDLATPFKWRQSYPYSPFGEVLEDHRT